MITFHCENCGREFTVAPDLAGRRGRCKSCGTDMVVPPATSKPAAHGAETTPAMQAAIVRPPAAKLVVHVPDDYERVSRSTREVERAVKPGLPIPPPVLPVPRKPPLRIRRLRAEADQMIHVFRQWPYIRILAADGDPPSRYQIEYQVRGLARGRDGRPVRREHHVVEIQLTADYPRQSPKCKILTPIFHPNFDPSTICVGDHWTAGERLIDLVVRIGEMIAYQAYNIKSPLDGEAAMWADLNQHRLPTDNIDLRPPEADDLLQNR